MKHVDIALIPGVSHSGMSLSGLVVLAVVALAAGCGGEEAIEHYSVDKPAPGDSGDKPSGGSPHSRPNARATPVYCAAVAAPAPVERRQLAYWRPLRGQVCGYGIHQHRRGRKRRDHSP